MYFDFGFEILRSFSSLYKIFKKLSLALKEVIIN